MSSKNVVSDAEWVQPRVAFMQLEAEHKAATIALAKKRQALPWRKIDQDYIFDGGLAGAEGMYDYVKPWPGGDAGPENLPGISIFKRNADGQVYHTDSVFCSALLEFVQYNIMFDLTPEGRPEGAPEMPFLKHKDAYQFPGGIY